MDILPPLVGLSVALILWLTVSILAARKLIRNWPRK